MENPEEVLQALDEFQKMRPSEIPRELEDYLCWVAKTGDPIYQWSLVKALFREKLMRVITEFYENCPTLDLTPCPNVEPFNYDMMKSTLLDRLENFPNAPFTVQRICELLTTPRKEYNRVDKFMRAIEKNILVVSTSEPGPLGRRSENGDNLVNGSVEDETSHHSQPSSNEVDMENWVKDCTATTNLEHGENGLKDRLETSSSVNSSVYTTPHIPTQDNPSAVQNLTTTNHDAAGIIADVSDAIMNEDTSSQPSLELESDDSNESKKLQTTFQAKDFPTEEEKTAAKTYSEALKQGKPEESIETEEEKTEEPEIPGTESEKTECTENSPVPEETDSKTDEPTPVETPVEVKNDSTEEVKEEESKTDEKIESEIETESPGEPIAETPSEEPAETPVEELTPIEEPIAETTEPVVEEEKTPEVIPEVTPEEIPEESKETVIAKIEPVSEPLPEPLPVVEETKGTEIQPVDPENSVSVIEEAMEAKETVKNGLDESPVEEENKMIEDLPVVKASTESMDVDNETQPDEPMEQETTEAMTS